MILSTFANYWFHAKASMCKESDARIVRGGGGELDNLKALTYGFTICTQR
jgi:hypothetical protein